MDGKYKKAAQNQEEEYLWFQQNYRLILENRRDNGGKNKEFT